MVRKWTKDKGFVAIPEGLKALHTDDIFYTVDGEKAGPLMVAKSEPYIATGYKVERYGIKAEFYNGELPK